MVDVDSCKWASLARTASWPVRAIYRREARTLATPRLVIQGERDFIPMNGSREWVAGNPNARLFVIPAVGHFPHVEAPETFFPAVETFLRGGWPEGAVAVE